MHSKHDPNAGHTMARTYKSHYSPYIHPHLNNGCPTPTWSQTQAKWILSLRDISTPPTKTPNTDIQRLDPDRQIHAMWIDTDRYLESALVRADLICRAPFSFGKGWDKAGRGLTSLCLVATWEIYTSKSQYISPVRRSRRHCCDVGSSASGISFLPSPFLPSFPILLRLRFSPHLHMQIQSRLS